MASHTIYTVFAVISLIIAFVLVGIGIYHSYNKDQVITTGQKWLYFGGGGAMAVIALILFSISSRIAGTNS